MRDIYDFFFFFKGKHACFVFIYEVENLNYDSMYIFPWRTEPGIVFEKYNFVTDVIVCMYVKDTDRDLQNITTFNLQQ